MPQEIKYPVTRSFLPPLQEYVHELESIWETHWLTNQGSKHQQLEEGLKTYLGVRNITLFTNGHLALDVAIKALGLQGEVITTPFTFASTTHAISMNGLTPVFCDIKPEDFTIDEAILESLITPRTSAILAVHVYGNPCAATAIDDIAKRHGLKVIYDAAHAFGEKIDGAPIGRLGDVSMFSFHATKVYHTIEGGALAFSDDSLKRSFDLFKNFGITGPESVEAVGLNAKMSEFQAAMGVVNLRYIDGEIESRKTVVDAYTALLDEVKGIRTPKRSSNVFYNNSYFPIIVDEDEFGISRDRLFDELAKYGIMPRKYFYPLVADFDCYKAAYGGSRLPVARKVAAEVLTLPLYSDLGLSDVKYICGRIAEIAERFRGGR
jgi:dTDP-4-amino-4,6-dideoxygalactose transaminase